MKAHERKLYIENIFTILFDSISIFLKYDDYYIFYHMFASKDNDYFIRKCLYCNKVPICPVNIRINLKDKESIICNKNLLNPVCYICLYENWIFNYNRIEIYNKIKKEYKCPFKCCNFGTNMFSVINNSNKFGNFRYKDLVNFDNKWNYLKNVDYYKCKYCGQIFINKHHYVIYKHYKFSKCNQILKKFENNYFCRTNKNIKNIKYHIILNEILEDNTFQ